METVRDPVNNPTKILAAKNFSWRDSWWNFHLLWDYRQTNSWQETWLDLDSAGFPAGYCQDPSSYFTRATKVFWFHNYIVVNLILHTYKYSKHNDIWRVVPPEKKIWFYDYHLVHFCGWRLIFRGSVREGGAMKILSMRLPNGTLYLARWTRTVPLSPRVWLFKGWITLYPHLC